MDGIAEIGGDPTAAGTTCAGQSSLDFSRIAACATGDQGTALLTAASAKYVAAIASEGKDHFVPDVQIDGKHEIPSHTYARLKQKICAAGSKAAACSSPAVEEDLGLCQVVYT